MFFVYSVSVQAFRKWIKKGSEENRSSKGWPYAPLSGAGQVDD
jgi:hypothetical protein